jgi:hypothetical protein
MTVTVPMSNLVSRLTVKVRISGRNLGRFRLWIGLKLLTAALTVVTSVIGCSADVDVRS